MVLTGKFSESEYVGTLHVLQAQPGWRFVSHPDKLHFGTETVDRSGFVLECLQNRIDPGDAQDLPHFGSRTQQLKRTRVVDGMAIAAHQHAQPGSCRSGLTLLRSISTLVSFGGSNHSRELAQFQGSREQVRALRELEDGDILHTPAPHHVACRSHGSARPGGAHFFKTPWTTEVMPLPLRGHLGRQTPLQIPEDQLFPADLVGMEIRSHIT